MRILLAEDTAVTRRILETHLRKWGHEVVACKDGTEAWEAIQREGAPQLVILDWMMPGMEGVQICREIRKLNMQPYVYIILLTSRSEKEDIVQGLDAGADDYVVKPFDPQELKVRVRAGCRIVRLQEELLAALRTSEFQASHDALTHLLNRAAILTTLQKELSRARREGGHVGVVMADVDHFKRVNDTYGHLAGDAVLRGVASGMAGCMRPYDSLGRYGGEEFIILLPGSDLDETKGIAERLRSEIDHLPLSTEEGEFHVTVSFGAGSVDGSKDCDIDSIIRMVDEALYRAKASGRNRVELWQDPCVTERTLDESVPISAKVLEWRGNGAAGYASGQ